MNTKITKISLIVVTLLLLCLTSCNQNKTIPIKAALLYKLDIQPVSRTKFYLLNKDLKALREDKNGKTVFLTPFVVEMLMQSSPNESFKAGIEEDGIKDYIVATATTDFEGNAKFENVPKGTYYICGFTTTRREGGYVVWSVPIDTNNIKETFLLDQNNAFEAQQ